MLSLGEVELAVIGYFHDDPDYAVDPRRGDDDRLVIVVRRKDDSARCGDDSTVSDRTEVAIVASGTEALILRLDDRYFMPEFDWESIGQKEILRLFSQLARLYLGGAGTEHSTPRRLGRSKVEFQLPFEGELYRFDPR